MNNRIKKIGFLSAKKEKHLLFIYFLFFIFIFYYLFFFKIDLTSWIISGEFFYILSYIHLVFFLYSLFI